MVNAWIRGERHICSTATAYVSSGLASSTRRISARIFPSSRVASSRSQTSGRFRASRYAGTMILRSGFSGSSSLLCQRSMADRIRDPACPSPREGAENAGSADGDRETTRSRPGCPVGRSVDPYRSSESARGNRLASAIRKTSGRIFCRRLVLASCSRDVTSRKTGIRRISAARVTTRAKTSSDITKQAFGCSVSSALTISAKLGRRWPRTSTRVSLEITRSVPESGESSFLRRRTKTSMPTASRDRTLSQSSSCRLSTATASFKFARAGLSDGDPSLFLRARFRGA